MTAVWVVFLVAALAPASVALLPALRLPAVVLEVLLGIAVGPQALGLVDPKAVQFLTQLAEFGLAYLFFAAGLELDLGHLRGPPITLAAWGWAVSILVAVAATAALWALGQVDAPVLIAIALSTTAMGTLLPILRDSGVLVERFGAFVVAAGAVGEFGPILTLSILASHDSGALQSVLLLSFVTVCAAAVWAALRLDSPALVGLLRRTMHGSSQLPVRLAVLVLVTLAVAAHELGLELILGAFAAGMIVGLSTEGEEGVVLRHKLDGLGFGFLVPVFFVMSGVHFDLDSLLASGSSLVRLPLFFVLLLVVRGAPAILYRRELPARDLLPLALYSATGLPLIVAITELGVATGRMRSDNAAALVGAGMLSVLALPALAAALRRGRG